MKRMTALLLALLLILSLSACGGEDENEALYGTYQLFAMDYDESTIVLTDDLFEGENYITLKSGGAADMCMEDEIANVRWKLDGTKLTVTAADGDMEGSLSDGILSLNSDGTNLYFAGENASTSGIHAVSLDDLLAGAVDEGIQEAFEALEPAELPSEEAEAPAELTEVQQMWNGWYYGCIDMTSCTGEWASLNNETFDAMLYVELDENGEGSFWIRDPYGVLISNDENNIYVEAECHADASYLYADSGTAFGVDLNTKDWVIVHNLAIPDKLNVGSASTNNAGDTIGYDFQFMPWGSRWEGDDYTKFIPEFDTYLQMLDEGIDLNAEEEPETAPEPEAAQQAATGDTTNVQSPLLGSAPSKLDINDKGVIFVYYPGDQFRYDSDYGKLKNDDSGVGILIDPMLGASNFEELKQSYQENNSDEEDYSLEETTVNGYQAQILKYSDWLGSTMRVDVDFGGEHDGFFGISFAVSGDSLNDCDTDLVWAVIQSMELAK